MKSTFAGLLFAAGLMIANGAAAGPTYIDQNGYAVSGYDVVAYFDMKQAPLGADQHEAVPGVEYIYAEYDGATYLFASMENRGRFLSDPAKYAPQFGGHCAQGVLANVKVPGNPNNWRIVDGKLYLTHERTTEAQWQKTMVKNIINAEDLWHNVEDLPSSTDPVKDLDPTRAPSRG